MFAFKYYCHSILYHIVSLQLYYVVFRPAQTWVVVAPVAGVCGAFSRLVLGGHCMSRPPRQEPEFLSHGCVCVYLRCSSMSWTSTSASSSTSGTHCHRRLLQLTLRTFRVSFVVDTVDSGLRHRPLLLRFVFYHCMFFCVCRFSSPPPCLASPGRWGGCNGRGPLGRPASRL